MKVMIYMLVAAAVCLGLAVISTIAFVISRGDSDGLIPVYATAPSLDTSNDLAAGKRAETLATLIPTIERLERSLHIRVDATDGWQTRARAAFGAGVMKVALAKMDEVCLAQGFPEPIYGDRSMASMASNVAEAMDSASAWLRAKAAIREQFEALRIRSSEGGPWTDLAMIRWELAAMDQTKEASRVMFTVLDAMEEAGID